MHYSTSVIMLVSFRLLDLSSRFSVNCCSPRFDCYTDQSVRFDGHLSKARALAIIGTSIAESERYILLAGVISSLNPSLVNALSTVNGHYTHNYSKINTF